MKRTQVTIIGESAAKGAAMSMIYLGLPFEMKPADQDVSNENRKYVFDVADEHLNGMPLPAPSSDGVQRVFNEALDPDESVLEALKAAAVAQYANDDIEIDDIPRFSHAKSEGGTWVSGWLWVSNAEAGIEDTDAKGDLCDHCHTTGKEISRTIGGKTICTDCDEDNQEEEQANAETVATFGGAAR